MISDIAILPGNVGKVELATTRPNDGDYVGQMVTLTGLGKPSDSATGISEVLREVTVPLISNEDCDAVYGIINDGIICFDSDGGMGSCNVSISVPYLFSHIYVL